MTFWIICRSISMLIWTFESPSFSDAIPAYEKLLVIANPDLAEKWPNLLRFRLRVLLRLARAKRLAGEITDAIGFLNEAELLAREHGEKERHLLANVYMERGNNYRRLSRWDKSRSEFNSCYRVFKEIEIATGEKQAKFYAVIERKLAGTHLFEGQALSALENCERSLYHCREIKDKKEEYKGLQHQAWAFAMLGRWDEALETHKYIVGTISKHPTDPFMAVKSKRYLGEIYRTCGVLRRAKEIFDEAENDLRILYRGQIRRDLLVYGMILLGQGTVYRALQTESKQAEKKLRESLDIHF